MAISASPKRAGRFVGFALVLTLAALPLSAAKKKVAPAAPVAPKLQLAVDATDAARSTFHAAETIPVSAGPLTLYYPKWIPGEHGPTGPVADLIDLRFTANGKPLEWKRDSEDMYTFHLDVPTGVSEIVAYLAYVSPTQGAYTAGASATSQLAIYNWNWTLLYPKGYASDAIPVVTSVTLPAGWKFATALPVAAQKGQQVSFGEVNLTTVVDSPVMMGAHLREVALASEVKQKHYLEIVADSEDELAITPDEQRRFDNLVREAGAAYGSHHYNDYRFLLTISDDVAHFGLEHHQSNDSRLGTGYLVDPNQFELRASLLPHEYTHSWNGKYRRPAGLATPEYETPMQGNLLWVYEGLTDYMGMLLAARSGLETPQHWVDEFAGIAATYSNYPARDWRSLEDTATAAQIGHGGEWTTRRRSLDYYEEGSLIWLEADVTIRQLTDGKKSLDDFLHIFHGLGGDTAPKVVPYTADDVYAALNQVVPYDWKGFFTDRVLKVAHNAPLGGLEKAGYKLVYKDEPNALASHAGRHGANLRYSLGLSVNDRGEIWDVVGDSLADKAKLAPGEKILAVNGYVFNGGRVTEALKEGVTSKEPLRLIVENQDRIRTVELDYHGGMRYPHLVRDESKPDLLLEIIKPHSPDFVPAPKADKK